MIRGYLKTNYSEKKSYCKAEDMKCFQLNDDNDCISRFVFIFLRLSLFAPRVTSIA